MGINAKTTRLKEDLVKLINESGLPVVNVCLVLENIHRDVISLLNESVQKELDQEKELDKNGN